MFFYMPLVHSEDLADQHDASRLINAVLRDELGEPGERTRAAAIAT